MRIFLFTIDEQNINCQSLLQATVLHFFDARTCPFDCQSSSLLCWTFDVSEKIVIRFRFACFLLQISQQN